MRRFIIAAAALAAAANALPAAAQQKLDFILNWEIGRASCRERVYSSV